MSDDTVTVVCQNCAWFGPEGATNPIEDLEQRVSPGELMPYGECPECGALCHKRQCDWCDNVLHSDFERRIRMCQQCQARQRASRNRDAARRALR